MRNRKCYGTGGAGGRSLRSLAGDKGQGRNSGAVVVRVGSWDSYLPGLGDTDQHFERQNPGIDVNVEFTRVDSYWQR